MTQSRKNASCAPILEGGGTVRRVVFVQRADVPSVPSDKVPSPTGLAALVFG